MRALPQRRPYRTPAATDARILTAVPRYLIELFAGAVCFIIASASFVFSVALDVKQMEEQNQEVRAPQRRWEPLGLIAPPSGKAQQA